jgi:hypothetical protein
MPLTFINGGGPAYRGDIFTTGAELIDKLDTYLTTAGWTEITKVSGTSLLMQGNSTNGHTCFVQFVIKVNSGLTNGRYLVVRGFHAQDLITGSPDNYHQFTFRESGINRLWLTADEDSGCLCIWGSTASCAGMHFGFLDRIEPTDQWAWMVGWIYSLGILYAFAAKSKHDGTNWRNIKAVYDYTASDDPWSRYSVLPTSCFDAVARGKPYISYSDGTNLNAFYYPNEGKNNYTGNPLIDRYHYLEGRASTTDYAAAQTTLYFRGYVKYAYCGVSQHAATRITTNPFNNEVILSVGGANWQGMRIA